MSQKQIVTRPGGSIIANGTTVGIGAAGVTFTVPAGKVWELLSVVSDTTASATVGNRVLQFRVLSGATAPVWIGAASGNVAAGQVGGYDVAFGSPISTPSTTVRRNIANTGNTNVQVRENAPRMMMVAGDTFTLDDSANTDNADSVTMYFVYIQYEA